MMTFEYVEDSGVAVLRLDGICGGDFSQLAIAVPVNEEFAARVDYALKQLQTKVYIRGTVK